MAVPLALPKLHNRLLANLPEDDLFILQRQFEPVALPQGTILVHPDTPNRYVYFLIDGIASQIAITPDDRRLEVGVYGRDGFGPTGTCLGVDRAPHQHIMQVGGHGFRIRVEAFDAAMAESPEALRLLLRFVHVFNLQTSYTALSNGSDVIGERLARWLLMCHDRIDGDDIGLTHEFLGIMLGVRRSGVTEAIHLLEGIKIIRATRGNIFILDRDRLEATAGDSYGVPEAEYARLIGRMGSA